MAAVTDKIATEYHLDENVAIEKLYSTQLYSYLEDEKQRCGTIARIRSLTYINQKQKRENWSFPNIEVNHMSKTMQFKVFCIEQYKISIT